MNRKLAGAILTVVLLATLAPAQEGQGQPQMTPEQQAEMEAYMAAGAPGAPHKALAESVGTYDLFPNHSWNATDPFRALSYGGIPIRFETNTTFTPGRSRSACATQVGP